jgi:hypothetical protein
VVRISSGGGSGGSGSSDDSRSSSTAGSNTSTGVSTSTSTSASASNNRTASVGVATHHPVVFFAYQLVAWWLFQRKGLHSTRDAGHGQAANSSWCVCGSECVRVRVRVRLAVCAYAVYGACALMCGCACACAWQAHLGALVLEAGPRPHEANFPLCGVAKPVKPRTRAEVHETRAQLVPRSAVPVDAA